MMNNYHPILSLILLAIIGVFPAFAADSKAGEEKAQICLGCHGQGGKSNNPQWPNLAAQQTTYLINQLKAFKSGGRKNPMMENIAGNLSDDDMNNLAAYFSKQSAATAGGDESLAKIGKDKSVMCLGCHGQTAEGNRQIPRLAGQHSDYLVTQLQHFKSGERENGQMQAIAGTLSEDDMKALAAYFGSL
jgi:cytochrome c553